MYQRWLLSSVYPWFWIVYKALSRVRIQSNPVSLHLPFKEISINRTNYTRFSSSDSDLFRCCKRLRLATYRRLYKSCSILSVWNAYCCCTRFCGKTERKRSLDRNHHWCYCTEYSTQHRNMLHKLGKTGSRLLFFIIIKIQIYVILFAIHRKNLISVLQAIKTRERLLEERSSSNQLLNW